MTLQQAHDQLRRRGHNAELGLRLDPRTPSGKPLLARLRRWLRP